MLLTRGSCAPSGDYPQVTLASAESSYSTCRRSGLGAVARCRALFEWRICRFHKPAVLTGLMSEAHHVTAAPGTSRGMRKSLAKHQLRRRAIALVAAYAVALSSLLASGVAARAAAELIAQSGGALCHTDVAGQAVPASGDNNTICTDYHCIACLTLVLGISPPHAKLTIAGKPSGQVLGLLATSLVAGRPCAKSHQSRAPPHEAA